MTAYGTGLNLTGFVTVNNKNQRSYNLVTQYDTEAGKSDSEQAVNKSDLGKPWWTLFAVTDPWTFKLKVMMRVLLASSY